MTGTQEKNRDVARALLLAIMAASMSGCAGVELRGAVGLHRVDESQSSQRTYKQAFICLFKRCDTPEDQGS